MSFTYFVSSPCINNNFENMRRKSNVVSLLTGFISSIFAFLGIITCCGLPIIAGALAWLGIGASQLEFFAKNQIWFIAIAVIALLFGFYQLYFNAKKNQNENECCSNKNELKNKKVFQKILLWSATVILILMFVFNKSQKEIKTSVQKNQEIQQDSIKTPSCCTK